MATGGRVLHHLAACLPDARHTVLFVGFQAEGTRGRALVDGAKAVKIHGAMVPVAARIERIDSMSAHADADEIVRWLKTFSRPPQQMYLVHGEAVGAGRAQEHKSNRRCGWTVHIPQHGEKVEVDLDVALSPDARTRPYHLEQIDDAAVVQLYADGFRRRSSHNDKVLVWHLYAGGARWPRHLLRPALSPQPRDARHPRGDTHARRRNR